MHRDNSHISELTEKVLLHFAITASRKAVIDIWISINSFKFIFSSLTIQQGFLQLDRED